MGLFKDNNIQSSYYGENATMLLNCLDDKKKLKELLFNNNCLTDTNQKYQYPREKCTIKIEKELERIKNKDISKESDFEKREVRCLFYRNNKGCLGKDCPLYKKKYELKNGSQRLGFVDYEVPTEKKYRNIGNIDLIINYNGKKYATEVKPNVKNNDYVKNDANKENLLRMISEILTYDFCCPNRFYREKNRYDNLAIAFFEDSFQHREYSGFPNDIQREHAQKKFHKIIKAILKKAHISVFMFVGNMQKGYSLRLLEKNI